MAKRIRGVTFEENLKNSMGLEFYNLSHRFGYQSPNWPYFEDVKIERIHYMAKSGVLSQRITTSMHNTTHIDAPAHVVQGTPFIDEVPLPHFFGSGIVISIPKRKWQQITYDDLEWWAAIRRRHVTDLATVRNIQRFLQAHGRLTPPLKSASRSTTLREAYEAMLRDVRGLAPTTVHQHATTARAFLDSFGYETTPDRLSGATSADVERFVHAAGARLSRASLQHTVAQLRSFLRFLASRALVRAGLDQQIDTPRLYRLEQLPRSLPWPTVQAFLRAIDGTTAQGLRDYTMFFLMATYGLRACEVVTLTLDAIDWRRRLIQIAPRKRGTVLLLPLTDAAGVASNGTQPTPSK